jgi:hypothetical protein
MTTNWIAHGFQLEQDVPEVGALAGDWVHVDPAYPDCPVRIIRRLSRDQSIRLLAVAAGARPWPASMEPAADEAQNTGRPAKKGKPARSRSKARGHLRVEV